MGFGDLGDSLRGALIDPQEPHIWSLEDFLSASMWDKSTLGQSRHGHGDLEPPKWVLFFFWFLKKEGPNGVSERSTTVVFVLSFFFGGGCDTQMEPLRLSVPQNGSLS